MPTGSSRRWSENLEIKRALLKKVEAARRPGTIVTTNTSGLPVGKIAEGFSDDFRRHWFGTHFFNPPRYMRLLEIIPTPDSDPAAVEAIAHFCDVRLGKGIVTAKDTPNFIANRIGTFSALNVMRLMQEMDLTIEEVDALTGSAVGWPKMGTFRLADMVGLDILGHVVSNMTQQPEGRAQRSPASRLLQGHAGAQMARRQNQGRFLQEGQRRAAAKRRLGLDWKTLEYRPRQKAKFPALEMAKQIEDTPQRLRTLLGMDGGGPQKGDRAGQFLWPVLSDLWTYSANRIGEICDSLVEIDRAMRMGFNWEMGPFELWDAAGVEATVARMKKEGRPVAENVERLLASGKKTWYSDAIGAPSGVAYFDVATAGYKDQQVSPGIWSVQVAKKSGGVVKKNAGRDAGGSGRWRGRASSSTPR